MNKLLLICLLSILATACSKKQEDKPIGMANPASVYCESIGGKLELIKNLNGWYGLCHLPNGKTIEEWELYRSNHK